jgi:hypothetical protein
MRQKKIFSFSNQRTELKCLVLEGEEEGATIQTLAKISIQEPARKLDAKAFKNASIDL